MYSFCKTTPYNNNVWQSLMSTENELEWIVPWYPLLCELEKVKYHTAEMCGRIQEQNTAQKKYIK